ncbi:hypothetical protein GCM10009097_08710 [Pigmentiphaga daeguensis]|uniref:Uncharacterized protein n=1 Tax=Pigmentiphaga daeguensis TaxID=414049 RepID=A0ABN1BCN4_9BURK
MELCIKNLGSKHGRVRRRGAAWGATEPVLAFGQDFPAFRCLAGRAQNSGGHSPPDCAYCRAQTAAPLLPHQAPERRRLQCAPSGPAPPDTACNVAKRGSHGAG